jgi:hypothetical protein
MSKTATEEERLKVYETLVSLYDKVEPIIERVADLNTFKYGELPLNPYMLVEAGITLRMVLDILRKIPHSQNKELQIIQRELEISLSNCIKAAEATEKYVEISGTSQSRIILNTIINSTVMANEYMESVAKRLAEFKSVNTPVKLPQEIPTVKEEVGKKQPVKEDIKPVSREPVKKKTGGVITVLDKIGDIIIFPIVKIADLSDSVGKSKKKK